MPTRTENTKQTTDVARKRQTIQPVGQDLALLPEQIPPLTQSVQRAVWDPGHASPADILALQRTAGNRAVSHLIQTKLTVGPVGDRYEQEADRVAEQVLTLPLPSPARGGAGGQVQRQDEEELQAKPLAATITPLVQRQDEEELQAKPLVQRQDEEELQAKPLVQRQDEEELQAKPLVQRQDEEELQARRLVQRQDEEELQAKPLVQRQDEEELQAKPLVQRQDEEELQAKPLVQRQDEEELQAKPLVQRQDEEELQAKPRVQRQAGGGFEAGPELENRLAVHKGSGSPLPDETRAFMEPRFGADFGGVRVHTGGEAVQMSKELKAQAFTHGQDIYLGEGRYDPGTAAGRRLLAHELTHVVQQTGETELQRQRLVECSPDAGSRIQRYTAASLRQPGPVNWQGETRSVTRPGEGVSGGVFFFQSDEEVVVKPEQTATPAQVRVLEKTLQAANIPVADTMRVVPGADPEANDIKQTVRDKLAIPEEKRPEIDKILAKAQTFFVQPKVTGADSLASLLKKANTQEKVDLVIRKLSSATLLKQLGRLMVIDLFMGMDDRVNAFTMHGKANLGNIMISGDEQASLVAIDNAASLRQLSQTQASPLQADYVLEDVQKLRQDPDRMIDFFFQVIREDYLGKLVTPQFNPERYFQEGFPLATLRGHIVNGMNDGVAELAGLVADKRRRAEIKEVVPGQEESDVSWETFRARGAWMAAHAGGATPEQAMVQATQYLQVRRAYKDWKAHVESLFQVDPGLKTVPPKPRGFLSRFSSDAKVYEAARDTFLQAIQDRAGEMQTLAAEIDQLISQGRGGDLEARKAQRKLQYITKTLKVSGGVEITRVIGELKTVYLAWMASLDVKKDAKRRTNLTVTFDLLRQGQTALMGSVGKIWIVRRPHGF